MIIRGRFIGDAPYFAVQLQAEDFQGMAWMLADTGASRTTLLDRDVRTLAIAVSALEPCAVPTVGIGGTVRSFEIDNVQITLSSDEGEITLQQDLCIVQHDLDQLPPEETSRILRLPSLLGRDIIHQFEFEMNYRSGIVQLTREY